MGMPTKPSATVESHDPLALYVRDTLLARWKQQRSTHETKWDDNRRMAEAKGVGVKWREQEGQQNVRAVSDGC